MANETKETNVLSRAAMERYPDNPVVLARGNTCLSCGKVQRDAFKAGAAWQVNHVWHKPDEEPSENYYIILEYDSPIENFYEIGRYHKDRKEIGDTPINKVVKWAYLDDLLYVN